MKSSLRKTIYLSLITFFVTSAVIASTGLNTYATTDNGKRIILNQDGTYSYVTKNVNNTYLGTYFIGNKSIDNYIINYLEKKGITEDSSQFEFAYSIMNSLYENDSDRVAKSIGNFSYTITEDKLIINKDNGREIFQWPYEIKDNILYATVYNSDKMAVGKFSDDGLYLEVSNLESNVKDKVLLQKGSIK
jgi:hypothetical protein